MVTARQVQSWTGHTIDALQTMADRLGFWPRLVFDRGFGNESIVTHLCAEGATFYVRLKGGRYVGCDGQRTEVKRLQEKDSTVQLFGTTLRVIRSPKSRRAPEPWYILTNDFASSRNKIVKIYYHRFEIEESFKDLKHVFEFRRVKLNKPNSLKVLLWLIFLGMAILYVVTRPTKDRSSSPTPRSRPPGSARHMSSCSRPTAWCSGVRVEV
jgi:IS4 transposase